MPWETVGDPGRGCEKGLTGFGVDSLGGLEKAGLHSERMLSRAGVMLRLRIS